MAKTNPNPRTSTDLFVRLNERERAALDSIVRQHGLSRSDLVRRMIWALHDGQWTPPMSTFEKWSSQR